MTKIFAHRGYSAKFPENTMLAFQKAYQAKADGIEIDVHLTKDEEIVVCHDEDLDRVTGTYGYIREKTLQELKSLSFHNNMDSYKDYKGLEIPTLKEFLEWAGPKDLEINIELKTNIFRYDGIVAKTLALVKDLCLEDRVILSSFNHNTIIQCKDLAPKIRCGFLSANSLAHPEDYCSKYGVEYYHISYLGLEEDTIEKCHKEGIGLNIWTVDDEIIMKKLLDDGVNGIITNEVEKATKLVGKK